MENYYDSRSDDEKNAIIRYIKYIQNSNELDKELDILFILPLIYDSISNLDYKSENSFIKKFNDFITENNDFSPISIIDNVFEKFPFVPVNDINKDQSNSVKPKKSYVPETISKPVKEVSYRKKVETKKKTYIQEKISEPVKETKFKLNRTKKRSNVYIQEKIPERVSEVSYIKPKITTKRMVMEETHSPIVILVEKENENELRGIQISKSDVLNKGNERITVEMVTRDATESYSFHSYSQSQSDVEMSRPIPVPVQNMSTSTSSSSYSSSSSSSSSSSDSESDPISYTQVEEALDKLSKNN